MKNKETCIEKLDCIACGKNDSLIRVLNLGNQPLANSFKKNQHDLEESYPLAINFCTNCSHLQLTHLVHQDELFKNYLYVSGTSKTQLEYFKWFAELAASRTNKRQGRVLDIGCNDGSQLNFFKTLGFDTYGVDPAENLHAISSQNHRVVCDYFNTDSVVFDALFDVIVCQNAFAHNYNQLQFLKKCRESLTDDGLVFLTISQATMVKNSEFDTIYHEHYSYYTVKSMNALCERAGLFLNDVVVHPIHGNTYIFILSKTSGSSEQVRQMLFDENTSGMSSLETYERYAENAQEIAKKFKVTVDEMKANGYTVIGYGSPAKGNTMLNFSGVTLDFIVDDNPLKQGTFTPGTCIPVVPVENLKMIPEKTNVCCVPLAWNFFEEIHKKIVDIRGGKPTTYIKYFPEFVVFAEN
jgi:SAM-dependent methyltransferase